MHELRCSHSSCVSSVFPPCSELLALEGIDCDSSFFESRISGRANALICADLLPHLTGQERDAWVERKEALFRERAAEGLEPLNGLMELLRAFRAAGVKVAAVTNAPKLNAHMILVALELHVGSGSELAFDELILGEECSHAKPHPEPYLEAMRRLGVKAEQCVVFEDSLPGAQAGAASGAVTVGVRTSQTDGALRKAGAHVTVRDFAEVEADKLIRELKDFKRADAVVDDAPAKKH